MLRSFRSWASGILTASAVGAGCTPADATLPDEVEPEAVAYQEGVASAPVHVIYFADYVCDDCARFSKTAAAPLREEWIQPGRARLTVVDLAWHRGSVAGSAAAVCAAEQEEFWAMHEMLFERQETWKRAVDIPAALEEYATELELDLDEFRSCASREGHQDRLNAAEETTRRFAVRGTPAFVVNGKLFYGSQDWAWVEQVLAAHERGTPEEAPAPPFRSPPEAGAAEATEAAEAAEAATDSAR
ncbi:MAG: DsbA family protein [Gemmatimonadaceae bacterium]